MQIKIEFNLQIRVPIWRRTKSPKLSASSPVKPKFLEFLRYKFQQNNHLPSINMYQLPNIKLRTYK